MYLLIDKYHNYLVTRSLSDLTRATCKMRKQLRESTWHEKILMWKSLPGLNFDILIPPYDHRPLYPLPYIMWNGLPGLPQASPVACSQLVLWQERNPCCCCCSLSSWSLQLLYSHSHFSHALVCHLLPLWDLAWRQLLASRERLSWKRNYVDRCLHMRQEMKYISISRKILLQMHETDNRKLFA